MYSTLVKALWDLRRLSKTTEKEQVLLDHADTPEFKRVINFLCDDFQVVGISTKKLAKDIAPITQFTTITEVLDYLVVHNTGTDEDVALVKGFLSTLPPEQADVLSQVIAKSWTTTVGSKVINKVYGDKFVPTFDVQLAFPFEKKEQGFKSDHVFIVTQKLDGYRAVAKIDERSVTLFSRKGKPLGEMTQLENSLRDFVVKNNIELPIVLDGELLLINSGNLTTGQLFQATSQMISKDGETKNIVMHVFDQLPLAEFEAGKSSARYISRRAQMDRWDNSEFVKVLPMLGTCSKDDVPSLATMIADNQWEGVMLNDPEAFYELKRSKGLLKFKEMKTADLQVIDIEYSIDGQFEGMVSALRVRLDDENSCLVGSGLTMELRHSIKNNPQDWIGKMIEVQYFEETTNKQGERSLRFPTFKCVRYDKTVEDTNIE